jgi:hypothetical protein
MSSENVAWRRHLVWAKEFQIETARANRQRKIGDWKPKTQN